MAGLGRKQPVGIGKVRPPTRPRTKSVGTIANPYIRALDGVPMVKLTFSISKDMAQRLQQYELVLRNEGLARNAWVEELIAFGIASNFLRLKDENEPPERREEG